MMGASSGSVKRRVLVGTGRAARVRTGRAESSCTERRELAPLSLFQCMTTQPQEDSAATWTIWESVKPLTSLTTEAPRRTHILAA